MNALLAWSLLAVVFICGIGLIIKRFYCGKRGCVCRQTTPTDVEVNNSLVAMHHQNLPDFLVDMSDTETEEDIIFSSDTKFAYNYK